MDSHSVKMAVLCPTSEHDCAYTKALRLLKNMVMIPTYAAELNSHMHYKCLDIRYEGWMLSDSKDLTKTRIFLGKIMLLQRVTMATSTIRREKETKTKHNKCYSYRLFWYFVNSIQGSFYIFFFLVFGLFNVTSQRFSVKSLQTSLLVSTLLLRGLSMAVSDNSIYSTLNCCVIVKK